MHHATRNALALISAMIVCAACATGRDTMPRTGPTIGEIYAGQASTSWRVLEAPQSERHERTVRAGNVDQAGYARHAGNELQQLFPRVPNPTLVMYVYPHLNAGKHPVPGYSTAFSMYESTPFAVPGEVEATWESSNR